MKLQRSYGDPVSVYSLSTEMEQSGWHRKLRTTVVIHYNPETLRPPPAPVEHEETADYSDHVTVESEHGPSTGTTWR